MQQSIPMPQGQYDTGDWSEVLGWRGEAPDVDVVGAETVRNSAGVRRVILVQNASGGTLVGGQALKFTADNFGKKVQKSANGSSIECFAPYTVDGQTDNTIPNLAYILAVYAGPTKALTDGAAITEGDILEASGTAGTVKTNVTVPAASKDTGNAVAMDDAAAQGTGDPVYVSIMANCPML